MSMKTKKTLTAWSASAFALAVIATILVSGCPMTPDGGNGEPPAGQSVTVTIVSPTSGFGVSVLDDQPITVIYTIQGEPDEIRGYYVPVASADPTSAPTGDPIIVTNDLDPGANQFFSFIPADAGVGFFKVGVIAIVGNTQIQRESTGVIQVEDHPNPSFLQPDQAITIVEQGNSVTIRFDAGDPQGNVRWRLFYLAPGDLGTAAPDQLGTALQQSGSGNLGQFTWNVGNLPAGDYRLGVSATDSGFTISQTVSRGLTDSIFTIPNDDVSTPVIRVVEPATATPPTLAFTAPGNEDVELFRDETFTIRFDGEIRVDGATGTIDIFYDTDRSTTNGFELIADDLPATATTAQFPNDLAEGTYNVGGTIRDGINQPVTVYAAGQVNVSRTLAVNVTAPATQQTFRPGDPITIAWTAIGPAGRGTFDVFAQRVNADGSPIGGPINILQNAPRSRTSATFTTNTSGLYDFRVVLELADGTSASDSSPAFARVSSLPEVIWTGLLADRFGPYEGAVFGGVNFEDNAGSALASAGDLNGDGVDEFVIAARYGKPDFINPNGIGPGEAYIVYGRSGGAKPRGEFNLNTVGLPALRGVALVGVSGDLMNTSGLADVTALPDMDDDGRNELAFGFPRISSSSRSFGSGLWSTRTGAMTRGGVIVLSSDNRILQDPTIFSSPTIFLNSVGFSLAIDPTQPEPTDQNGPIFDDFRQFQEDDDPGTGMCEDGTDGVLDTISSIDPEGFRGSLANPELFPDYVEPGTIESEEVCVTEILAPILCGPAFLGGELPIGTGTEPRNLVSADPKGARFIGPENDARFGASITVSKVSGSPIDFDVIMSAPNLLSNSGLAYLLSGLNSYWGSATEVGAPGPFMFNVGAPSRCLLGLPTDFPQVIIGGAGDAIETIEGVEDFNGDARDDIGVGAPMASSGRGKFYIAYRRDPSLEGDFALSDLSRNPSDAERLDGFLVVADPVDEYSSARLGSSMASGFDYDRDGIADLAVSLPGSFDGAGSVLILFSARELVSPSDGYTVNELLALRRLSDGSPVAALIKGNPIDSAGAFGFNITNGGDLDGDGLDDLVVAAPNATPRFDPDPTDEVDELTEPGVDLDGDGLADPVPGGASLTNAGLVYVIYGKNRLDQLQTCSISSTVCSSEDDCPDGETCGGDMIINVNQLGSSQLAGFMLAGRKTGDRLGGGDAGDTNQGGIAIKAGRGRSRGLSTAGDVDGDNRDDLIIGSVLADPRPNQEPPGVTNAGEVYLLYGSSAPR